MKKNNFFLFSLISIFVHGSSYTKNFDHKLVAAATIILPSYIVSKFAHRALIHKVTQLKKEQDQQEKKVTVLSHKTFNYTNPHSLNNLIQESLALERLKQKINKWSLINDFFAINRILVGALSANLVALLVGQRILSFEYLIKEASQEENQALKCLSALLVSLSTFVYCMLDTFTDIKNDSRVDDYTLPRQNTECPQKSIDIIA